MIGRKRHRFTVWENKSITLPGGGMSEPQEVIYWDTWGEITPIKAKRTLEAYQEELRGGFEIRCRFRPDKAVRKDMTVKYKGKDMVVHSVVNEDELSKELVIIAMRND